MGRRAIVATGDMSDMSQVERVFQQTVEAFGRIDILICNAAYEVHTNALDTSLEDFSRSLNVIATSSFRLAQLAADHMAQRGQGGKIIFISSIHGEVPFADSVAYNAAKAGLNHMACSLAGELAKYRINVNVIPRHSP